MPRVSGKLARLARKTSPLLLPLLQATKSLSVAKNELRWIKNELPKHKWHQAVQRRANLEPLQYILGSQPFGDLDILCEPGVLIPRWETEEWTTKLAHAVESTSVLSMVDACTGTGCIPILMKHLLPNWEVAAFDVSAEAVKLAEKNAAKSMCEVTVHQQDIFTTDGLAWSNVDLVTANPPYIPLLDYTRPVALNGPETSVKFYEPQLALVGNLEFYTALAKTIVVPLTCSGFVFELGYEEQVAETVRWLPGEWEHGRYFDSAGKLRCVVGWKRGSELAVLRSLVNEKKVSK